MRPVESFNIGKAGEHKERVMFEEASSCICKHDRKQIACDHESKDERSAV